MKTRVFILAGLFLAIIGFSAKAQTDEQAVEQVIKSMFDGMRAKNPEQVAAAFSPDAIMQTVMAKPDGSTVGSNAVADFVKRIATTPAETQLDEQILDYQIKIDGTMASAWTPYKFYVNGNFSHCGVNSFQLVKMAEGWKIVYIIDTRRKENCED
ncbi:nuclear transport factor 2 family protein [Algoriphagus mannitolivorans]|uniref:nuclear transport factor 2 family protein n=1 Tax=Algoriphagus mannitolivorans TaxID=226504 RepID=UPI0003FE9448|nr:nuclear transport factor 2 family protein [Algoriphagus mannitolivorans]